MKQGKSIGRQNKNANVAKIIFPFSCSEQTNLENQLKEHRSDNERKKHTFFSDFSKATSVKNNSHKQRSLKSHKNARQHMTESLSKPIVGISKKNPVDQRDLTVLEGSKKNNNFLLVDLNAFKKHKHRSLSKQRSMTNFANPFKTPQIQYSSMLKRVKKQRSLTKLQSYWTQGRAVQKQKQSQILHKFDSQKIDRNRDHLGKLKKSTLKKNEINTKFVSFKNVAKEINQIDKESFEKAQTQFNRKYNLKVLKPSELIAQQTQINEPNYSNKAHSPKPVNRNYIRKSPAHAKKQPVARSKQQKNVRASADEQFLKARVDFISFERSSQGDSFFSETNPKGTPVQEKMKQKQVRKMEEFSESENHFFEKQRMSQNEGTDFMKQIESVIFDKVYFFSSQLSSGFASLFTIERINLKSKGSQNLIIEVVIKAYQQIVVQRIIYSKNKRNDGFRRQKAMSQKEQEKQRLKNELFSELIVKRQLAANRESFPESIDMRSEMYNLARNSELTGQQLQVGSIEAVRSSNMKSEEKSKGGMSSINFSKVSTECYQQIIKYIQKYCQLQVSYLGAYLKQSDSAVAIFNQLMKKKHSQMQQTLLESLNLAKILYFLIKINSTYYIAKTVILGNKKIKYYVLYEFSNMIRHERQCLIEEEEEMDDSMARMRKIQLAGCLYKRVNLFFVGTVLNSWNRTKTGDTGIYNKAGRGKPNTRVEQCSLNLKGSAHQQPNVNNPQPNFSLLNALQICFGSIRQIGVACNINSQSERLYKITQSNFRNDIRWQKPEVFYNANLNYENFFQFHNAFDYELVPGNRQEVNGEKPQSYGRVLFVSSLVESGDFKERLRFGKCFSYTIGRRFELMINLYPSAVKSRHQLVRFHPTRLREHKLQDHFTKQQFLLLHTIQDTNTPFMLNSFLKKQYITSLSKQIRQQSSSTPFFTVIKNKKYYVEVYVPFLQQPNPFNGQRRDLMKQMVEILLEGRTSVKRHCLRMTVEDVFLEIKEYYRLFADSRTYRKFAEIVKRASKQMHTLPREFFVQKLKFYVSRLYLMKKNTYSHFYFIPVPTLISEASHRVSVLEKPKSTRKLDTSQSLVSYPTIDPHKSLVLHALQALQTSLKQQEKLSKSTISKIKIKNFPTYEIYYKTTRRLIPGYFVIVSIYYMPIFDLSEIKFYLTKVHKSFFVPIKKTLDPAQYENLVMVQMEFLKDRFFVQIIASETAKLSCKYKDFYSRMMRQAQSPFISKTRRKKQGMMHASSHRNRNPRRNYALSEVEFIELTEELLCKVFQSRRQNKYLVRLSYPATECYVCEYKRKGIDELIDINIIKQNCMVIYKFQTTARKLLSKKVTHKFNVLQLQYQEKNKPFYILFEQIKILIEESDQSTYGLLNTFRSYFLNKHYNATTKNNFISMFSINLLAGISNKHLAGISTNLLNNDHLTLNRNATPYHFDSQKDINIKDLNSSLYQRYCLFIEGGFMLEVLKIRKNNPKTKIHSQHSNHSGGLPSIISRDMKRRNPLERSKNRKQSIQANLASLNLLSFIKSSNTPHIRMTPPNTLHPHHQSPQFDHFIQDSYNSSPHQNTELQDSRYPNLDEKLVYLINTDTQHVTEIQSSLEDQGFVINVPFGAYNRKMFRRLFRNVAGRGGLAEEQEGKDESFAEGCHASKSAQNFSLLY